MTQLIGVAAYGVTTVVSAFAIFGAIQATMGLRVSEEEELEGLDYAEHGMHAYDFGGSTSMKPSGPVSSARPAPAGVLASERSGA